jgi:hypothetical protein
LNIVGIPAKYFENSCTNISSLTSPLVLLGNYEAYSSYLGSCSTWLTKEKKSSGSEYLILPNKIWVNSCIGVSRVALSVFIYIVPFYIKPFTNEALGIPSSIT